MAPRKQSSVETLVPESATVVVAGTEYTIKTFKFAKSARALQYIAEIAETAGLRDSLKDAFSAEGQLQDGWLTRVVVQLLAVIPGLLRDGMPSVYRLIGLIVTGNDELKKLEKDDTTDVDSVLYERGRELGYEAETDEIFALINAGISKVGIDTVLKNVLPLMMGR